MNRRQERIAKEREELDQQKKLLMKRKPPSSPHPSSKSRPKQNGPNDDGFVRPAPEFMNQSEFYERDEILKLRQSALKKVKERDISDGQSFLSPFLSRLRSKYETIVVTISGDGGGVNISG